MYISFSFHSAPAVNKLKWIILPWANFLVRNHMTSSELHSFQSKQWELFTDLLSTAASRLAKCGNFLMTKLTLQYLYGPMPHCEAVQFRYHQIMHSLVSALKCHSCAHYFDWIYAITKTGHLPIMYWLQLAALLQCYYKQAVGFDSAQFAANL